MSYTREEYDRNTRHALFGVAVATLIGFLGVWWFFESVRTPSHFREVPSISEPIDEQLVAESNDTS
ncbi:MAG: hypothetical protein WBK28_01395 [Minisyncoccia bacterium]